MKKDSLVRTIYLYLFTIIGLSLLVIGAAGFVNMGLKIFVFTEADDPQKFNQQYRDYNMFPVNISKMEQYQEGAELTDEEKIIIKELLKDYKESKEAEDKIDYLVSQRQQDASRNLSFILIGLPLYLFHWGIIKKETRKGERDNS